MGKQDKQTQSVESRDKKPLESDIQSTRYRLDQTLTALEGKLSPQQLMNDGFDYFRYGGPGQFTGNLGDSVKNNPVPFLLTAVGLSWLMLAPRSGPTHHDLGQSSSETSTSSEGKSATTQGATGSSSSGRSTLDATKDKLATTRDKANSATGGIRDGARSMTKSMSSGSSQMRDGSRNAARNASRGARNATNQTVQFVENNPLAAAGIGIGLGLALGALFPASRFEDEQLGGIRDDMVDKASEAGADQADKLSSKVDEKADEARPDSTTAHDNESSPSSSDRSSSDESGGLGDTSQDRSDRTSQAGRPDSHTDDKDLTSGSRSSTAEPAEHSDAPMPGARQAPDKRHY